MSIARTNATGAEGMLPELIALSSSLPEDRSFVREDLLGSAAHVTMLGRTALVPPADARALRDALLAMYGEATRGALVLPDGEEDVHMAVEAELGRRVGAAAARLHTARSRNDQIALDLRLYVRRECVEILRGAVAVATMIAERASASTADLLPAYTHRQRAQPISAGFLLAAWGIDLVRAAETVAFALDRADELPLGSGACSGTSLPIDRELVKRLLGFSRLTPNALLAVGDRGFLLDFTWGAARVGLALARLAADVVDYATSEFGLVTLDGAVSAGSSMMPQKKNPDIFELVRGKSARAVANVVHLLALVKGLPSGYNRDQQEDRAAMLAAGPLARGALRAVELSLPHVHFDAARGRAALADGTTQATDLAEALVRRGVPFREAYKAVGALVRAAVDGGIALGSVPAARAQTIHPALDAEALRALDPVAAVAAKESPGGTGPGAVAAQIEGLRASIDALTRAANPRFELASIAEAIVREPS